VALLDWIGLGQILFLGLSGLVEIRVRTSFSLRILSDWLFL
jgi:hypothetical protein